MLHYAIQCHGPDLEQVRWLLRLLDHPAVSIAVWHDGLHDDRPLWGGAESAAHISYQASGALTYCGYSQVSALLTSLRFALEHEAKWEWFINLSGTCAPLRPQQDVISFLSAQQEKGILNHFFSFRVRRAVPDLVLSDLAGLHYELVPVRRPMLYCEQGSRSVFENPELNPFSNPAMRTHLQVAEILGARTLYVRPPLTEESRSRHDFFRHHPHFAGRAWFVMHRRVCELLTDSFLHPEALFPNLFSRCLMPDESAIHTWMRSRKDVLERSVAVDNLRLDMGRPQILGSRDISRLASTRALFARKIRFGDALLRTYLENAAVSGTSSRISARP